ncbi:unnamed protein product [Cylindrotheca closterium]|uniref:Leucine-rich repeat-containing N-terminal plant-type domain-containing protein n=1 Tax=Cylindrotheca closterium TaxID=2856 RepID=A0AAD2CK69_9STRA|nr:unnamed protein product [Cylindrotheca closterium]
MVEEEDKKQTITNKDDHQDAGASPSRSKNRDGHHRKRREEGEKKVGVAIGVDIKDKKRRGHRKSSSRSPRPSSTKTKSDDDIKAKEKSRRHGDRKSSSRSPRPSSTRAKSDDDIKTKEKSRRHGDRKSSSRSPRPSSTRSKSDDSVKAKAKAGKAGAGKSLSLSPGAQSVGLDGSSRSHSSDADQKRRSRRSTKVLKPGAESVSSTDRNDRDSRAKRSASCGRSSTMTGGMDIVLEGDVMERGTIPAKNDNGELMIAATILEEEDKEARETKVQARVEEGKRRPQKGFEEMPLRMLEDEGGQGAATDDEARKKKPCWKSPKVLVLVLILLVSGGIAVFFALFGSKSELTEKDAQLDFPAAPAIVTTSAPSGPPSNWPSSAPSVALKYDPPSLEQCEAIAKGEVTDEQQQSLTLKTVVVHMDALMDANDPDNIDTAVVASELQNAFQRVLVPALARCPFNTDVGRRSLLGNSAVRPGNKTFLRRELSNEPYVVDAGVVTVEVSADVSCSQIAASPSCLFVSVILDLYLHEDLKFWELIGLVSEASTSGDIINLTELLGLPSPPFIRLVITDSLPGNDTDSPTAFPTGVPSVSPSFAPTKEATPAPSAQPVTPAPSMAPFVGQTPSPSTIPSSSPTFAPTNLPSESPSGSPSTPRPTLAPVVGPTPPPTGYPTANPSSVPTKLPSESPSGSPSTPRPTLAPVVGPTPPPTGYPTANPSSVPTKLPSESPSGSPSTPRPTLAPVVGPTPPPTSFPTPSPSTEPSLIPTNIPSESPSSSPSTPQPTLAPVVGPTPPPTSFPTPSPSTQPSLEPTPGPSKAPTPTPTPAPTPEPTPEPTSAPTSSPTYLPTTSPSVSPTAFDRQQAVAAHITAEGFTNSVNDAVNWILTVDDWYPSSSTDAAAMIVERYIMAALFYKTGGETNWLTKTGWLSTDSVCSWHGIGCAGGRVRDIDLGFNSLKNRIPSELGRINGLEKLYLHNNALTGRIPKAILKESIKRLHLDQNDLRGTIRTDIGRMSNLISLKFFGNNLGPGTLPTEIGSLTALTRLYLSDSGISGTMPTEFVNLVNLNDLRMQKNQMTGTIPQLGKSNIPTCDLSQNSFSSKGNGRNAGCVV